MSCDHVAVTQVQSVQSTHSQSNYSKISTEHDSHADTCVVGSNIVVVHDHVLLMSMVSTKRPGMPMPPYHKCCDCVQRSHHRLKLDVQNGDH